MHITSRCMCSIESLPFRQTEQGEHEVRTPFVGRFSLSAENFKGLRRNIRFPVWQADPFVSLLCPCHTACPWRLLEEFWTRVLHRHRSFNNDRAGRVREHGVHLRLKYIFANHTASSAGSSFLGGGSFQISQSALKQAANAGTSVIYPLPTSTDSSDRLPLQSLTSYRAST